MKIGLLISGKLGNSVFEVIREYYLITFILTDKNSLDIIKNCEKLKIPIFVGNPRNGKAISVIDALECDLIVSVNYLYLIEKDIIQKPNKIAINFHGSLLPKYRGRTPHVWAIINDERESGITAHLIDEGCDTGEVIDQIRFEISDTDTGGSLLEKFLIFYPTFVLKTIKAIEDGNFYLQTQAHKKATFFGKREPKDGRINWDWQLRRIYNWIRAQSNPYPGAYTFLNGHKIIIHSSESIDFGFNFKIPNGTILDIIGNYLVVKVPNGCLLLKEVDLQDCDENPKVNDILI